MFLPTSLIWVILQKTEPGKKNVSDRWLGKSEREEIDV